MFPFFFGFLFFDGRKEKDGACNMGAYLDVPCPLRIRVRLHRIWYRSVI